MHHKLPLRSCDCKVALCFLGSEGYDDQRDVTNMAAVAALLQEADNRIKAAVAQETEDGDPALAAAHYARAGELILVILKDYQFSSPEAAAWVAGTLKPKLLEYTERARLLLSVADEAAAEKADAGAGGAPATMTVASGNVRVGLLGAAEVHTDDDDDVSCAKKQKPAAAHADPARGPELTFKPAAEEPDSLGSPPSVGTLLEKFAGGDADA